VFVCTPCWFPASPAISVPGAPLKPSPSGKWQQRGYYKEVIPLGWRMLREICGDGDLHSTWSAIRTSSHFSTGLEDRNIPSSSSARPHHTSEPENCSPSSIPSQTSALTFAVNYAIETLGDGPVGTPTHQPLRMPNGARYRCLCRRRSMWRRRRQAGTMRAIYKPQRSQKINNFSSLPPLVRSL